MAGPGGEVIVKKASCLRAVLRPGSPRSEEMQKTMLPKVTLTSVEEGGNVAGLSHGGSQQQGK
jgi:hypothetical protein